MNDEQKFRHLFWEQNKNERFNWVFESVWYRVKERSRFWSKIRQEKFGQTDEQNHCCNSARGVDNNNEYLLNPRMYSTNWL